MKRARTTRTTKGSAELTGGSGDVNPQTLVVSVTQSANNVPAIIGNPLPIPRLSQTNGKQLIMEFLSVDFLWTGTAPTSAYELYLAITTNPTQQTSLQTLFQDPRVIAIRGISGQILTSTSAPSDYLVAFNFDRILHQDLTDEAGHGILVATDNIYFTILTTNMTAPIYADARITYRFKEVGLAEYVGIVQSQQ